MFESVDARMPARVPTYEPTLWAFGSGELKTQGQIWAFSALKGKKLQTKYDVLQKFELVWDFMPILHICKFRKNPIKTKQAMPRRESNMGFSVLKGK